MEILLLKSAACLAILMVFYKLFLEKLSVHKFKRFYLLGALLVSAVIPFITFIEYIEPIYNFGNAEMFEGNPPYFPVDKIIEESQPINYLPIILWSIYGLGVLLFAVKFSINLSGIILKINKNEKQKHNNFISVLLNDLIVPHTFFSYIFLNKTKFEAKAIPQEVLLHEQTHAKQKHSLDILFIELLQVIFWFNPLLYFIKKDIKLNHEFLADEAVLKQGIDSSAYQETLLQFTSNANEIPLAHAINYSLIKKRFTIMKTQTSKKAIWLRSLLLLPLLGGLLFSFSSIKEVEKEIVPAMVFPEETENQDLKSLNDILTEEQKHKFEASQIMYIIDKDEYYKNVTFKIRDENKNIITTKNYDELTKTQKLLLPPPPPSKPMQRSPSQNKLSDWQDDNKYGIWVDGKRISNSSLDAFLPSSFVYYFQSKLEKNAINYGKHYYQVNLYTQKAFDKAYPDKIKPLTKNTEIFISVSLEAKAKKNNQKINYAARSIDIKIFNNGTYKIDGIKATKNTFKQVINQLHRDITPEIRNNIINIHVNSPKDISDKEVWFIYNSVLDYGFHRIVAYNQEIIRSKGNTPFAIDSENKNDEPTIKNTLNKSVNTINNQYNSQTKKPILTVNGIVCDRCQLNLSKKGVENIILGTTTEDNIKDFKIKFIGKPSVWVKGNKLNIKAIANLNEASLEDAVQLFDIKTESKQKLGPVIITLVDKNNKNYSHSPVVKKGEDSNIPPPPPPTAPAGRENERQTAFVTINGSTHFKVTNKGDIKYYNRKGFLVDKNGKILSSSQINGSKVIPGQKIAKVYQNGKVVVEFKKTWNDDHDENWNNIPPPPPPPPAPKSPIDQIVYMAKKGATFYYNAGKISSDRAIEIVKNNSKVNISSHSDNGNSTVHISTKPISVVNGRASIIKDRKEALKKRKQQREEELEKRNVLLEQRRQERQAILEERKRMKEKRPPLHKQFIGMEANGGEFFYEGKKIPEAKAIALIKENPKLNVSMHVNNGKGTIHLSKKGISTVNGKLVKKQN